MAYITRVKTELGTKPAPFMASFSSRGPNPVEQSILKPDITAPGVSIIAAYTQATGPTDGEFDKRRIPFNTESGTFMSCPHVSGIVGLLKTLHPTWTPAAIKSAIKTTARKRDNNKGTMLDSSKARATSSAYGAGYVQPIRAMMGVIVSADGLRRSTVRKVVKVLSQEQTESFGGGGTVSIED